MMNYKWVSECSNTADKSNRSHIPDAAWDDDHIADAHSAMPSLSVFQPTPYPWHSAALQHLCAFRLCLKEITYVVQPKQAGSRGALLTCLGNGMLNVCMKHMTIIVYEAI